MAEAEPKPVQEIPEEVLEKVAEQLRFYFGNVNMLRDKFMKDVMMKNDGWFPLETLLSFNRLKTLLKDYDNEKALKIVVDGAKKLPLLEVHSDEKLVRRDQTMEFPKTRPENNTLVVKGFKTDDVTMDDCLGFFKKYTGIDAVIMRSYREKVVEGADLEDPNDHKLPEVSYRKKFKGSVFAVFDNTENAKVCLEDLKDFKGESKLLNPETPLQVMWQTDHKLQKHEATKARQELKRKADTKVDEKAIVKLGTIINMKNVPADVSRESLKETWSKALKDYDGEDDLTIAFIDYKLGQLDGRIRLANQSAKSAVEFMKDKLIFNEKPAVELSELAAEDEEAYLKQVAQLKSVPKRAKQNKHHGHGHGHNRQRGGGRRR